MIIRQAYDVTAEPHRPHCGIQETKALLLVSRFVGNVGIR